MAYQGINTGTTPNDGTGDTLLTGGVKINSNFQEVYNLIGDGSTLLVGVVTQISAGTNVSISTSYGSVQVSAPTPSSIVTTELSVSGVTTLGVTTTTSLLVSGITTLASQGGITTTGGDFYVGGDLYVLDDIVYDEVTGRNINITGVGTIGTLHVGGGHSSSTLIVSGVSTLTGNVSLGSSLLISDNKQIVFGDNGELLIYHSDSDGNTLKDGIGNFNILSENFNAKSGSGSTEILLLNTDGTYNVELYNSGIKRFTTTQDGVRVFGNLIASGITTLGVVTGATYYGDGSNLTLTGADASGVTGITTLIQAGSNISVTTNSGISTISYTGVANTSNVSANTLVVSGVSTLGVVTGATYYGDGSNLTLTGADGSGMTGVVTTLTGADASNVTGITTLISAGSNISVTTNSGISTISYTGVANTANINADSLVVTGVSTLGVVTATNQYNTGIVTAIGGFVSAASTQAVQITFSGTTLTFTVAGIGSTSLTLS